MPQRLDGEIVHEIKIAGAGSLALRDCREDAVHHLPHSDGLAEAANGFWGGALGTVAEFLRLLQGDDSRLFGEGDDVGVALEVFLAAIGIVAPADRIGKIQGELSAGQVEFELRLTLCVCLNCNCSRSVRRLARVNSESAYWLR